jgi:hypothetical protein
MDWSQIVYAVILASAIYTGRPAPIIIFAMTGNFLGTMLLAQEPLDVAIVDLVAVILLAGSSRRGNVVAALYVAMIPIYLAGPALGLPPWVVYTAVDVLAILQCGVIGGWDQGLGRIGGGGRYRNRRHAGGLVPAPQRRDAFSRVDISQGQDRRGTR